MDKEIIEPTKFTQEITREIVKQNQAIILQNEQILRVLLNPMVVVQGGATWSRNKAPSNAPERECPDCGKIFPD